MNLELVSFPFCPYGHRTRIALLRAGLEHKVVLVEPDKMPEWFKAASPLGKVPLLIVDATTAIFESSVINELVDQLSGGAMLPTDPVARARARSWVEFASTCQGEFGAMVRAQDDDAFIAARTALHGHLKHLEAEVDPVGPFFLGEGFSLVDAAFAPLFARMLVLEPGLPCLPEHIPHVTHWAKRIGTLDEVHAAVDGDLAGQFREMVTRLGPKGYVATKIGLK